VAWWTSFSGIFYSVVSSLFGSHVTWFISLLLLTCLALLHCADFFVFQILSRQKPAVGASSSIEKEKSTKKKLPKLEDLLDARDYMGAITLLEVFL